MVTPLGLQLCGSTKMNRTVLAAIFVLAIVVAAYSVGYFRASGDHASRDFEHYKQLAELDRSFLTGVVTRPSTLTTGSYILETRFPGKAPKFDFLELMFSNGRFALPMPTAPRRHGMADTLVQNGNVVSWHHEGVMYESNAECVGLIDGNMIWGRIYGWNPGDESIGVWRIYSKPKD